MITKEKLRALSMAYARGEPAGAACRIAGVAYKTAVAHYTDLIDEGVEREPVIQRRGRGPVVRYIGPAMIGKAA